MYHRIDVLALGDWSSGETPQPLPSIGERGRLPGQFLQPRGVALVGDTLIVAEFHGKRLQVLTLDGLPLQVLLAAEHLVSISISADNEQVICGAVQAERDDELLPPSVLTMAAEIEVEHRKNQPASYCHPLQLLVLSLRR